MVRPSTELTQPLPHAWITYTAKDMYRISETKILGLRRLRLWLCSPALGKVSQPWWEVSSHHVQGIWKEHAQDNRTHEIETKCIISLGHSLKGTVLFLKASVPFCKPPHGRGLHPGAIAIGVYIVMLPTFCVLQPTLIHAIKVNANEVHANKVFIASHVLST